MSENSATGIERFSHRRLLLTVKEAAEVLGLSPRMVYEFANRKMFPEGVVIRLGKSMYLSRPRLEIWLGAREKEEKERQELRVRTAGVVWPRY
ncbi:MAG: helix-turn-helix domain-containing protein [Nitrospirae bacterium]|nr:helix-turn-helix domain-containing protein [Nitrospirota bacterium]